MIVLGAGGFAKQLVDVVVSHLLPREELFFFDDTASSRSLFLEKFKVVNLIDEASQLLNINSRFCLGLGGVSSRQTLTHKFEQMGGNIETIVSEDANISQFDVVIEKGCTILANCLIEPSTRIGKGCLLNVGVIVTHDCAVGSFCEFGPGVILCGRVRVENNVFIGAGAVILPDVVVGEGATVAAGAVVNKDVAPYKTVRGVPAK